MKKDKVWLKLKKYFLTRRKSKKLDWKNIKYIIKKVLNLYSVKLDILKSINNAFYVNILYIISTDFFFSQLINNIQFLPIQDDGEDEWIIKKIITEIKKKREKKWKKKYKIK